MCALVQFCVVAFRKGLLGLLFTADLIDAFQHYPRRTTLKNLKF